jgi:cytochrome c oxidase subunit 3
MKTVTNSTAKETNYAVEPRKFSLWLLIIGMSMLFAALTSAYIVRQAEGNWFDFVLPQFFTYSTVVVVLSSITMVFAYHAAKKDELPNVKLGMVLTLCLGITFCLLQFYGWKDMVSNGLFFTNPEGNKVSASFVYAISGIHCLHAMGGIIFLLVVLIKTFALKVHKKNLLSINMCNTYWHFVGILWVYLYLFLNLTRQL